MSAAPFALSALLGLMSIPHCMGMCGPIAAAACGRSRASTRTYHVARLATYAALGALASFAARPLREWLPRGAVLPMLSIVTATALLFSARRVLGQCANDGTWLPAASLVRKPGPMPAFVPAGLGALTGLLPCGSLYGALAASATALRPSHAALSMLIFGAISGMGLALSNIAARVLIADASGTGRRVVASVMIVGAVLALVRPLVMPEASAACHSAFDSGSSSTEGESR